MINKFTRHKLQNSLLVIFTKSRFAEQIAAYIISAIAGGAMFRLWQRLHVDDRQRVWRLYGRYCCLMVCGSCVGVVTWAARLMNLLNFYKGNDAVANGRAAEGHAHQALSRTFTAAFFVTYATASHLHALCVTLSPGMPLISCC